ncbi:MAG: RNA polymerase sigma factor [Marinovum sp.]|nr:RNA polymerase sigma factor [Marinovum sp.]
MVRRVSREQAVRTAVKSHHRDVWRFALGLTAHPQEAEDLVQATCLRALEKAHTLKHTEGLRAWLITLARSIWLNERRAQAIRKAESFDEGVHFDADVFFKGAETNIFAREVLEHVMALPEAQREAVVMTYGLGYKYREVAEMLDVPIGTVMSRLSAARQTLRSLRDSEPSASAHKGPHA